MQLTAVEPYHYEEAEVEIDNETETIDLRPEATLGGTTTGSIEVDVGTDLEHRTVTVTVPNGDGELTESLEVEYLDDAQTPGFDIIASDGDEYYIIEAKFKSNSGSVSNSSTWFDRPNKGPQMTDEWIESTINDMQDSEDEEVADLGDELLDAREIGQTNDELVIVQNDEQNELTVLETLVEGDMDIDRVHIVKLEKVID